MSNTSTNLFSRLLMAVGFEDTAFATPLVNVTSKESGLLHPSGIVAVRRECIGEEGWHVTDNAGRAIFLGDLSCDPGSEGYSLEHVAHELAGVCEMIDNQMAVNNANNKD